MYEMTLLRMHEMTRLLMHGMTLLLVHEMTRLLMQRIYFFFLLFLEAAFCAVSAGLIRLNLQGGMRKAPVAQTGPCMLWTMKGMNS